MPRTTRPEQGSILVPQVNAWVRIGNDKEPALVQQTRVDGNGLMLLVFSPKRKESRWVAPGQLRSGFQPGMEVQDVPASRTRAPLGEGIVVGTRILGGRDQVLVDFLERGECIWVPFENLKWIKGVRKRFESAQIGEPGNAERFRLRCLAHAIELWNENTGALSRLHIDPLPHQIHLVHHILSSGNLNWLIADDVGLGKTIEVGMLLSALVRRGMFRRILLVTPAGLVRQWKDELHYKFFMSDFLIYGEDFNVAEARSWKLYDHVIGSMDRLKSDDNMAKLIEAGAWDLVVFDEAHRLGRAQVGMKYQSTDRFRLAAMLRGQTDAMLLLTATPHQGKQDKFQALLELIRPELKREIRSLESSPDILRQMVIRNHKRDVTDAEGRFIFSGKITRAIQVQLGEIEEDFDKTLLRYLREGYAAGQQRGGRQGRAIGFVMNIYRKLSASSIAAIVKALAGRLERIILREATRAPDLDAMEEQDERYSGEWEEKEAFTAGGQEFFSGEIGMIERLIQKAKEVLQADSKLNCFMDGLLSIIMNNDAGEKVVIFTEYRATQEYLAETLRDRFGADAVSLIHGGLDHHERERSIAHFEDAGKFLLSTEAGGEGINLHRKCHIMVNYDLPWNPMRLVQREGRLYRYGQKDKVIIFNLNVPETFDGSILNLLYDRIGQVVRDMSVLGGEFRPGLEAEILGEIVDVLEIEDVLEKAALAGLHHTEESIDEALKRAREAVEKQRELLEYAAGYDPDEAKDEMRISSEHVRAFVEGMIEQLGIEVRETSHGESVLRIRLPDELAEKVGLRGRQLRITWVRDLAVHRPDIHMIDLDSPLLREMLSRAKSYSFDGRVASVKGLDAVCAATAMLRWQNDQGRRMRQEFAAYLLRADGIVDRNPDDFNRWLVYRAEDGRRPLRQEEAKRALLSLEQEMDQRLAELANQYIHPENAQLLGASTC